MNILIFLAFLIFIMLLVAVIFLYRRLQEVSGESHLSVIRQRLKSQIAESDSEQPLPEFSAETSVIYKLKLDGVETFITEDIQLESFELELNDRQFYYIDSDPLALLEKPLALAVFYQGELERFIRLAKPVLLDDILLPVSGFDGYYQEPVSNIGYAFYAMNFPDIFLQQGNRQAKETLAPFTYPRPNNGTAGTPPVSVGPNGQPCTPTMLFVGLTFDGTTDGISSAGNRLNGQANTIADTFKRRGYPNAKNFVAGTNGADIDALLRNLTNSIPQAFCTCPTDQLVILITAHGWKASSNPTGKVAMRFQPSNKSADDSWVTHGDMAQKLGTILAAYAKNKITILIYSCRSSVAFDNGNYNATLGGSLLITSTDTNTLCFTSYGTILHSCLYDKKNKTWKDLLDCLTKKLTKEKKKNKKTPLPKGDVLVTPPP